MTVAQTILPRLADPAHLDRRTGAIVFLAFAAAYFCSALVRAITATLSPVLTQEFTLHARDLGLLAGGYFFGFAAIQLPLGKWLDKHGPKHVILWFLSLAVLGCLAFSMASSFTWLLAARVLVGMGVGACLMAPLTGYRRWFDASTLLRANSWMLMTGSLGMLASTLPVQWLLPLTGWRALFWILAAMILLAMVAIVWLVPAWQANTKPRAGATDVEAAAASGSYSEIWKNRYFRKMVPLAFFNYAGLVAMQTLWAGPWLIKVSGYTPLEAATGLFCINGAMLLTFWSWGMANPWLAARGWSTDRLVTWGAPVSMVLLAANILGGSSTGWQGWAVFCMATSVMGLMQPAVGMAFRSSLAGRALSAYNLAIFAGVFVVQWGIGLLIDAFTDIGFAQVASFQAAMGVYLCCCIASYAYFVSMKADNSPQ
ncbi:MFS transporter [Polaromonas sp.]|uniref:MFS transporter n=1 Tax=Polaromonas sp. TaxID=1869339 RepID=UPI003BAAAA1E